MDGDRIFNGQRIRHENGTKNGGVSDISDVFLLFNNIQYLFEISSLMGLTQLLHTGTWMDNLSYKVSYLTGGSCSQLFFLIC